MNHQLPIIYNVVTSHKEARHDEGTPKVIRFRYYFNFKIYSVLILIL